MLIKTVTIETVTFSSDSEYPELSGYGDDVVCIIKHHAEENVEQSLTISIDGKLYFPRQLEMLLEYVDKYKKAALAFNQE
jgi:hypothetical protein